MTETIPSPTELEQQERKALTSLQALFLKREIANAGAARRELNRHEHAGSHLHREALTEAFAHLDELRQEQCPLIKPEHSERLLRIALEGVGVPHTLIRRAMANLRGEQQCRFL